MSSDVVVTDSLPMGAHAASSPMLTIAVASGRAIFGMVDLILDAVGWASDRFRLALEHAKAGAHPIGAVMFRGRLLIPRCLRMGL